MVFLFYAVNDTLSGDTKNYYVKASDKFSDRGELPKTQFTGKDSETLTINGVLMPEITGIYSQYYCPCETLAEQGEPLPLIDGNYFSCFRLVCH